MKFAGAYHVKLVRLDVGHARIHSVDTTQACQLEGVHYVLTDRDFPIPMPRYGPFLNDQPIIATGETKFFGSRDRRSRRKSSQPGEGGL
jgi:xanthine dehydrogenase molybdopterin-binding subunit B